MPSPATKRFFLKEIFFPFRVTHSELDEFGVVVLSDVWTSEERVAQTAIAIRCPVNVVQHNLKGGAVGLVLGESRNNLGARMKKTAHIFKLPRLEGSLGGEMTKNRGGGGGLISRYSHRNTEDVAGGETFLKVDVRCEIVKYRRSPKFSESPEQLDATVLVGVASNKVADLMNKAEGLGGLVAGAGTEGEDQIRNRSVAVNSRHSEPAGNFGALKKSNGKRMHLLGNCCCGGGV